MPPRNLKVLICGGGIAGLTLAVLLERAGIDYEVFERARQVRPLGSALGIGPNVMPMIEQLGLLDQFLTISKANDFVSNFNEDLELTSRYAYTELPERNGYANYVVPRPKLYDLLYSQIPSSKVHLGKRFVSSEQTTGSNNNSEDEQRHGVTVTFADSTTAYGDILVGADGTYSGVRQNLYEQLSQQGKLTPSDMEELPCSSICLVGQTGPLSTEKFPHLREKYCRFENVSGNAISWMVIEHLYLETNRTTILENTEWGTASTDTMIEAVRQFPIPSGSGSNGSPLTLADLIDETPRELITQVALEGKMYPSAAQGANTAIQDAIVLCNYLHNMPDASPESITKAFEGYHQEREPYARQTYETSDRLRQLFRKRPINAVIRFLVKYIPQAVWNRVFDSIYGNRPQVAFLPRVPDRGLIKAFLQKSLDL
ncbi:hypothetical protein BG011_003363 [Mortierella polycephala]|uniref:FAD-binding domain-containing protein n=1 Tax=Mortierella polycephala TaxID=41804 RepID=A0A9P6U3Q7_9FUNG|nr:hypothetical protein BG011_003363 [Mortierella polycephala]